ncbi:hypothetical protein L3X38_036857 [Prunus dulcis]|uniref:Chromo domain-containing protein n=1 Tax=Prunus dulcis TaxID=3755 RepID=A0AAD4V283_PRUDU|nr:hypothetical protein L3X38_036857 [Prunus dulcis]
MHESIEEQEGNLQEEELEFAPAALDDSRPVVEDPLQEINQGTKEDPRPTFISTLLKEPFKDEIIVLLHDFKDCFAWHYHEMPELDRGLVEHKLPIKEGYLLVKQGRRRMSMDVLGKVLALPVDLARLHDVFHISMLRKYISDPSHVLEEQPVELKADFTYVEQQVQILDWKMQVLRSREIPLVKVLWRSHTMEEATWEPEDQMREQYLHLFE